MSNTGTSSGAIDISNMELNLEFLNLADTSATSSWVGNDTSVLANATGQNFTVTTDNDNITFTIDGTAVGPISITAQDYTTNADLASEITTQIQTAIR